MHRQYRKPILALE